MDVFEDARFDFAQSDSILLNKTLLEDVTVSLALTTLIESIQINKASKCDLFVNQNAIKAKVSGAPPRTLLGELLSLPQTPN